MFSFGAGLFDPFLISTLNKIELNYTDTKAETQNPILDLSKILHPFFLSAQLKLYWYSDETAVNFLQRLFFPTQSDILVCVFQGRYIHDLGLFLHCSCLACFLALVKH